MVCDNSHNTADISTMKNIVLEYSDIFEGEGNFQEALKLDIDEAIPPVKSPLRRIPIALKPKLKNELQRLEKLYKTSCYSYILGFKPSNSKETKWQNTSMYRSETSKQSFKEMSLPASDHRRSTSGTK